MDLGKFDKFILKEDFIDLSQAKANVDSVVRNISTMEDWLNMARSLVVSGKRDDAMKVSVAINKKSIILAKEIKKIPSRRVTNIRNRRTKMV
jgi:hypothetical protein